MPSWMFVGPIVAALAASPASRALEGSVPYAHGAPSSWHAVDIVTSNSSRIADRRFGPAVGAVVYDAQPDRSPADDIADIAAAEARVCAAAHRVNALCIESPLGPADFTATALEAACKVADAVDIQIQLQETNLDQYRRNAHDAAAHCKSINPDVKIILGITTRAGETTTNATPEEIEAAIDATRDVADRYWFNAPRPGRICPDCGPFSPEIVEAVIEHYAPEH